MIGWKEQLAGQGGVMVKVNREHDTFVVFQFYYYYQYLQSTTTFNLLPFSSIHLFIYTFNPTYIIHLTFNSIKSCMIIRLITMTSTATSTFIMIIQIHCNQYTVTQSTAIERTASIPLYLIPYHSCCPYHSIRQRSNPLHTSQYI